jgi:hypothetical protein
MMKFIKKALEYIQMAFEMAGVLIIGYFTIKFVIQPIAMVLSPIITILFVLIFTSTTFIHRTTAILAIGGIALYIASWPAVNVWGIWPGMFVWSLGVIAWFGAVILSGYIASTDNWKYPTIQTAAG